MAKRNRYHANPDDLEYLINNLGKIAKLRMAGKTLRQGGREIGISAPTLLRIMQNMEPDLSTFMKVYKWISK